MFASNDELVEYLHLPIESLMRNHLVQDLYRPDETIVGPEIKDEPTVKKLAVLLFDESDQAIDNMKEFVRKLASKSQQICSKSIGGGLSLTFAQENPHD